MLKQRFYALKDGFRVHDLERISKLIKVAIILHNLSIKFNDHGKNLPPPDTGRRYLDQEEIEETEYVGVNYVNEVDNHREDIVNNYFSE